MPNSVEGFTYCKRGYFRWGKISRKCWPDISRGDNFYDSTPISFINAYGFFFRVGVVFAKKTKARKNAKITPMRKFPRLQYVTEDSPYFFAFIYSLKNSIINIY